jgi:thiol-disulfide isomerase/thioredoxin
MQMALFALGAALSLLAAAPSTAGVETATRATDELIGHSAPAWSFDRWVRGGPLSLASLRGRVVLVRWWTDGCPYCATTLPVLEQLEARYAERGLVVVGAYHPKPPREVSDRQILAAAKKLGFTGPVAFDGEWSTLERYWLGGHPERGWTSVSFLIDRNGVIRWLHGGGEYHPSSDPRHASCDLEYRGLEQAVRAALEEPATMPAAR